MKVLISVAAPCPAEKVESVRKTLCDFLGVEAEDVLFLPEGISFHVLEHAPSGKPKQSASHAREESHTTIGKASTTKSGS